jgi:hypothetical protein
MTREEIDLLDGFRVWHLEQFRKTFDAKLRARANRARLQALEHHHALAVELLTKALTELKGAKR